MKQYSVIVLTNGDKYMVDYTAEYIFKIFQEENNPTVLLAAVIPFDDNCKYTREYLDKVKFSNIIIGVSNIVTIWNYNFF